MSEKVNRVVVDIAGESYVLRSDAPSEHIEQVVQAVNEAMKDVRTRNSWLPSLRVVVMAALNITDKYLRLKEDHENLVRLIESERVN